jgi:polar amino acid transport system substrate-binding protein
VAYAVARENKPLIDALNSGLDAVIADGTWSRLYSDWVPVRCRRAGSQAPRPLRHPIFRTSPRLPPARGKPEARGATAPKSVLAQLRESFFSWDLYKKAIPDLFRTGLPNTLILTFSAASIGLLLGMALAIAGISRARWLRWPARIYTDIFRGLPEVVIILLIGLGVGPIVGGLTGNNPFPLGIAALGLMAAAYVGRSCGPASRASSRTAGGFAGTGLQLPVGDAADRRPAGHPTRAARADEPVHLAAEGVLAGVLPRPDRQPARAVPGRPRPQRPDR